MLEIYSRLMTRKYIVKEYMAKPRRQGGASAVEYGLLVALIVVAVATLGKTVLKAFTDTDTGQVS